ncbi:hypothetical protein FD724_06890 [Nostoc sp. C057]|uniref:hypothetical protein n=1 Tax=Nostoc sp. C057 TaxID=2576903 RepID=UPI0015C2F99A|nr:hypothetical protein [Nostoc sp. C057]QLE47863.1 hypothetical protein FD724_06890 [Nostoc sp. C057]
MLHSLGSDVALASHQSPTTHPRPSPLRLLHIQAPKASAADCWNNLEGREGLSSQRTKELP